jgi:thymidylate synthase
MLELIVAINNDYGIGIKGKLPWKCRADLIMFKRLTERSTLIMGRKTCASLPRLIGRNIICMSRNTPDTDGWLNDVSVINSIEDYNNNIISDVKYIVAGGSDIYGLFINLHPVIHLSVVDDNSVCDTFFKKSWLEGYVIIKREKLDGFEYIRLEYEGVNSESRYLSIARDIVEEGPSRIGRNGEVKSVFGRNMSFDLRDGFPLLTTKRMFLRGIVEELLFFMRGDTDTTILSDKQVKIWEGNTSAQFIENRGLPYAEGVMGPMYGYQWRTFNKKYDIDSDGRHVKSTDDGSIDQLKMVVDLIINDPTSRRILMTTYNPSQAREGVLYPCHSVITQFYVDGIFLDMFCYNRSQDFFLGTPYNIASSSMLLMVISKLTNKTPRYFNLSTGDTHLYSSHCVVMSEQIDRIPYKKPKLFIDRDIGRIEDINSLVFSDFRLEDYKCHGSLKVDMVV